MLREQTNVAWSFTEDVISDIGVGSDVEDMWVVGCDDDQSVVWAGQLSQSLYSPV